MIVHETVFFIGAVLSVGVLLSSAYVLIFAILGTPYRPAEKASAGGLKTRTRFLILVPAHDEELVIGATLGSLAQLDYPPELYHVIVIADNCRDRTASVVEAAGVECWRREAHDMPGKGQALHWALNRARSLDFDAVVFIDADTVAAPQFLAALNTRLSRGARVVQGRYDFQLETRDWFSLLAIASKRTENDLFWEPRQRLGLAIFLQGNGFCVCRDVLEHIPWSAFSIVEDLEFSVELALRGVRIEFENSAAVSSRLPGSLSSTHSQRLRWASGTFQVMYRYVPRLVLNGLRRGSMYLIESAVALLLTSRVVLVYLALLTLGVAIWVRPAKLAWGMAGAVILAALFQFVYFLRLLETLGPETITWRARAMLPVYVAWMLMVQCAALVGVRRNVWTRTSR